MSPDQFDKLKSIIADPVSDIAIYYYPDSKFIMGVRGSTVTVDIDKRIPYSKMDIKSLGFYRRISDFKLV